MLPSLIGIIASSGGAVGGDFESIATVTVGAGGSSSITFSSIPSTYQHLQLRVTARGTNTGDSADALNIRFNSDSGSNYAIHQLFGNGSSAVATGGGGQTAIQPVYIAASALSSGIFGVGVVDILDYKDSNKYKTARGLSGYDANGSGIVLLRSGLWMNTAAITSITITPNASNYAEYSSFALYGIKG